MAMVEKTKNKILAALKSQGEPITSQRLSYLTDISRQTCRKYCVQLKELDKVRIDVERVEHDRTTSIRPYNEYHMYSIAP